MSNNEYNSLDVGQEGLIFNNSGDLVNTKLAGWIGANNNFTKDENASLIVNTIRSKRSELLGLMEVAGASSDLIILNTNGITCNGCGFINVNRGILSTGEAFFSKDGVLDTIAVRGGEVEIGKNGFNGAESNRIDIISQKLRLNGAIYGKDVSVLLGREDYDYRGGTSKFIDEGNAADYVISSNQFGGIYGNAISLVSKESSIGVNVDFTMATSGSKLSVDSAGNLTINNKVSSNAGELELKGNTINIESKGSLYSNNDTNIYSSNLNIDKYADLYSAGNYYITGRSLIGNGNIHSEKNLALTFNNVDLLNGLLTSSKPINISSSLINIRNTLNGKNVNLNGDNINICGLVNGDNIGVNSNNTILLLGAISSNKSTSLESKEVNISNKVESKGSVTVKSYNTNIQGNILAEGNISLINTNYLNLTGLVKSNLDLNISANNFKLVLLLLA